MGRASKSVWTYTLSTVEDLPPCPDDLSEPRYAHLIFSNNCHVRMDSKPSPRLSFANLTYSVKDCLRPLSELVKDDEALLLYLEARTQLCRACSLKQCVTQTQYSGLLLLIDLRCNDSDMQFQTLERTS
jgi:hypothetical protein